jgi:uncharacterized protein (TIGR03545 family)
MGGQDNQNRSVGLRKKGLVILLVAAALFCVWAFVLSDRWLEKRLESLLGNVVGARVELYKFDFSLFGMRVQWARLQVADPEDPWRNLFETGYSTLDLDSAPLFKGKFIVQEMSLLELRFDTERSTEGSLPEKRRRKRPSRIKTFIQKKLEQKLSEIPLFDKDTLIGSMDIEKLWQSFAPESPGRIDRLVKEYESFSSEWDEKLKGLDVEKEIFTVKSELEKIDVDKLETPEQLKSATERLNRIADRSGTIGETLDSRGSELGKELEELHANSSYVEGWIEEDLGRVQAAVQLPEISLKNIAVIMFGPKIVGRVQKVIRIIEKFRAITAKIRRFVPIKQVPPRLKGQDISFAKGRTLPGLWLKRVSFSGYTRDNIQLKGTVRDLSSGQHLTGRPTLLEVEGGTAGTMNFLLQGSFDWREAVPRDRFVLVMKNIVLQDVHLTDFPLVPNTIKSGTATLKAEMELEEEGFSSSIIFGIDDVLLLLPEKEGASPVENRILEVSRLVASDISRIRIEADLEILSDRTEVAVRSNLDALVAAKTDEILKREVEGVRKELERRVGEVTSQSMRDLDRIMGDSEKAVLAYLGELEKAEAAVEAQISKKRREIEVRIEEQTVGKKKRELEEEKRKKEQELLQKLDVPQEPKAPEDLPKSIESLF